MTPEQNAAVVAFALSHGCDPRAWEIMVEDLVKSYARILSECLAEATPEDIVEATAYFEKLLRARLAEMAEPAPKVLH
jgi:hypothetical protein